MAEPISKVRAQYDGQRVNYDDNGIVRHGWVTRVRRQYLPPVNGKPPKIPFIDYATVATDDGWLRPGVPIRALSRTADKS